MFSYLKTIFRAYEIFFWYDLKFSVQFAFCSRQKLGGCYILVNEVVSVRWKRVMYVFCLFLKSTMICVSACVFFSTFEKCYFHVNRGKIFHTKQRGFYILVPEFIKKKKHKAIQRYICVLELLMNEIQKKNNVFCNWGDFCKSSVILLISHTN